ncbi:MAG: 6-bladed beta-propeller [Acidobacteriota bacterium]|nr:6-bladed beta-propeller [Acidobacteriota bacterium]MDW3228301.1 6-bladed beta-propeller [Acidobacteriota bacterium]
MNSKGDYFLFSRVEEKIMQFDRAGNFIRFIGSIGQGPGEYQMVTKTFFDQEDNLYLYDAATLAISIFSYPDYQFLRQIHLKSIVNKIFINSEGNFITFSSFNVPSLLKKYDKSGELLIETFRPEDERLRVAMAPFNPGGLADIPGLGFLFMALLQIC